MQQPPDQKDVSWLVPIAGPGIPPLKLEPNPNGQTLGRHEQCDLLLPADAEQVSRMHARFAFDGQRWKIADLGSRWGTYLNGYKIKPGVELPLKDGDLVRIAPWTFTLSPTPQRRGLQSQNDAGQTVVRSVSQESARPLADDMLALLLESAAAIHAAVDERQLNDLVMNAAIRGTGLQNAVLLRPIDSAGHVEIVGSKSPASGAAASAPVGFSRSLIAAASSGSVAELSGNGGGVSQSIVQMQIAAAICVPIMLGTTVAEYLYLDSRGTLMQALHQHASAFCVALGRMASLAKSNLKRLEMEVREQHFQTELNAAAAAQKWIFPKRSCRCATFDCIGESKPGQYIGGDFFDIIELSPTRAAVALGDVAGKGISASVLMTATQGFLHATLQRHGESPADDVAAAVKAVTRFVAPRRPENKFVTMWVGIFDRDAGTLSYVDAGHSYALLHHADGTFEQLDQGGGLPVGLDEDGDYDAITVAIQPGDRVMVVSDGIIEQFGVTQRPDGGIGREQFEIAGVRRSLQNAGADAVENVFAAVVNHAGTTQLSDDATVVLIRV